MILEGAVNPTERRWPAAAGFECPYKFLSGI
jgi:hypothetical protein